MNKLRRALCILTIVAVLTASLYAPATAAASGAKTASPTSSAVLIDGERVPFQAYTIEGNNYFKLRDIAMALNGSEKQFNVTYSGSANAMFLTSGQAYVSVGGELGNSGSAKSVTASPTASKVFLDNEQQSFMAYTIGGNNYFKLRDLGSALNFSVGWDGATNTIKIETAKSYGPTLVFMSYMSVKSIQVLADRVRQLAVNAGYRLAVQDFTNNDPVKLVQDACSQKAAGIIVGGGGTIAEQFVPIAQKAGIPIISIYSEFTNGNTGKLLTAGVCFDAYESGAMCVKWTADNCKKYGLTVTDQSKLAFLVVTNTSIGGTLTATTNGAVEAIGSIYPGCHITVVDTAKQKNGGYSEEDAANAVSEAIKVNAGCKQWFIVCADPLFAQGVLNAVSAASLDAKTIMTSVGDDVISDKWLHQNYNGCLKACCYFSMNDMADAAVPAIDSVIIGTAAMSSLFADEKLKGETYAVHHVTSVMLDKAAYLKMVG